MKLCLLLYHGRPGDLALAGQMGVRRVVAKLHPEVTGTAGPDNLAALRYHQERYAEFGLELIGLEGDPMDMTRIKYGLPGRDEDVNRYQQMLGNMGKLGIRLLCYNFMIGIGWYRTRFDMPERGGALAAGFDLALAKRLGGVDHPIHAAEVWAHLEWFLESAAVG